MKKTVLILIIVLSGGGILFFSKNFISPYVSFSEAKKTLSQVQIIGLPQESTSPVYTTEGCLLINLKDYYDSDSEITVQYCGVVPQNLQHSEKIAAHGSYNMEEKVFRAKRLYYKCPSKYTKQQ